jgi:DNA-binding winged helix-turn-helix (wHTH) protein
LFIDRFLIALAPIDLACIGLHRKDSVAHSPEGFPKVVLVALIGRAGRRVTKHELLEGIWPGVFVDEGILTVHVAALRKALGDTRRSPTYIETVSRSGYRFIAVVVQKTL